MKNVSTKNIYGEKIDIIVEGNEASKDVVIFVHGFGTDKDEGFTSFIDLSDYLSKDFLNIRFDLTGYGKSEGKDYAFQYHKATEDVQAVIRYVREMYPDKNINIIAHSQGTFVVSLLSPYGIKKTIFTAIVNSNTDFVSKFLQERIISKGGVIDKNGISVYPRSKGSTQLIGKDFWTILENFDPIKYITAFSNITDLTIFKPINDDVLENKYFDEYKSIPNVKYYEVPGNHNFTNTDDRNALLLKIKNILLA